MKPGDWPEGYGHLLVEETDSTMAEAARRLRDLDRPTWIFARRQTDGRGRRGRAWVAPEGNLAATLVLPRPGGALAAAQRSFVAALAVFEAMRRFVASGGPQDASARVALKWPNDVLIDRRKIAGILLEAHGAGPDHLAIGIGVNLVAAPPADGLEAGAVPPIALSDICAPPCAEDFLSVLAQAYAREEACFSRAGFEHTRRAWLGHAARLGETITARAGGRETTGVFEGIDASGQLILDVDGSRVAIPAADVYF